MAFFWCTELIFINYDKLPFVNVLKLYSFFNGRKMSFICFMHRKKNDLLGPNYELSF